MTTDPKTDDAEPDLQHGAFGKVTWPDGITQEEAERLAREADAERERQGLQ